MSSNPREKVLSSIEIWGTKGLRVQLIHWSPDKITMDNKYVFSKPRVSFVPLNRHLTWTFNWLLPSVRLSQSSNVVMFVCSSLTAQILATILPVVSPRVYWLSHSPPPPSSHVACPPCLHYSVLYCTVMFSYCIILYNDVQYLYYTVQWCTVPVLYCTLMYSSCTILYSDVQYLLYFLHGRPNTRTARVYSNIGHP